METEVIARCTEARVADAAKFAEWLNQAMTTRKINTTDRQAAFLATIAVESNNLTATQEDLYYKDAARLAKIFPRAFKSAAQAVPYVRDPVALGQLLYKGYWGRGLIQLSWAYNYRAAGLALGVDFLSNPGLVAQPEYAAKTAAWYWEDRGCNEAADAKDMTAVTMRVNGPALLHLDRRVRLYDQAREILS